MKQFRYILPLILLAVALVAGCSQAPASNAPTATPGAKKAASSGSSAQGYITPVQHADLAFRTSGRVAQVLVKEGDTVKANQPLVKLDDADLKAALAGAQADLARLKAGARPQEIAQAQANVDVANSQVAAAQSDLDRLLSGAPRAADLAAAEAQLAQASAQLKTVQDAYNSILDARDLCKENHYKCGGVSGRVDQITVQYQAAQAAYDAAQKRVTQARSTAGSDVEGARARVASATAQRDAAQAQLALLKAGSTADQVQAAEAGVARAQAALDEAVLLAPFDGSVSQVPVNLGEMVAPGAPVVSLADHVQWQVETDDLSEVDIVNVKPGADATITVDALPGLTLHGKVVAITPRSIVKRGDVTYTVKVSITDPDPRLRWGMTSYVDIGK